MKTIIQIFLILLLPFHSFSQSPFDKALSEISTDLAGKLNQKGIKKVVVLFVTDLNKTQTIAGKYIANVISNNIVNDSGNFEVYDRDNLSSITEAKKLIDEGYVDVDKTRELGKILSVDAVVVGTYTILYKKMSLTIKALSATNGFVIASGMKDLPLDNDAGALLGINVSNDNSDKSEINIANDNRGFNHPLNSNEQYNNPETVNKECASKNTGDYCFTNNTSKKLTVMIDPGFSEASVLTLDPGQAQCFYEIRTGSHGYKITEATVWNGYSSNSGAYSSGGQNSPPAQYFAQGQINVEKCKSKTFEIK